MDSIPWTEEPQGPDVRYLARMAAPGGRSKFTDFVWPETGYVEAGNWQQPLPPGVVAVYKPIDFKVPATGGLHGFLDGGKPQSWSVPIFFMDYGKGLFQILAVKASELVCLSDASMEHKVPRAWVKYAGGMEWVCSQLTAEGTDYSRRVADAIREGAKFCQIPYDSALENVQHPPAKELPMLTRYFGKYLVEMRLAG